MDRVIYGAAWTRRRINGAHVTESVRRSGGAYCPMERVTWDGPHIVNDGERDYMVLRSTVHRGKIDAELSVLTIDGPCVRFLNEPDPAPVLQDIRAADTS